MAKQVHPPFTFLFTVRRSAPGNALGVSLRKCAAYGHLCVHAVSLGVVWMKNQELDAMEQTVEYKVRLGDYIVVVNGETDVEARIAQLRDATELHMQVTRFGAHPSLTANPHWPLRKRCKDMLKEYLDQLHFSSFCKTTSLSACKCYLSSLLLVPLAGLPDIVLSAVVRLSRGNFAAEPPDLSAWRHQPPPLLATINLGGDFVVIESYDGMEDEGDRPIEHGLGYLALSAGDRLIVPLNTLRHKHATDAARFCSYAVGQFGDQAGWFPAHIVKPAKEILVGGDFVVMECYDAMEEPDIGYLELSAGDRLMVQPNTLTQSDNNTRNMFPSYAFGKCGPKAGWFPAHLVKPATEVGIIEMPIFEKIAIQPRDAHHFKSHDEKFDRPSRP